MYYSIYVLYCAILLYCYYIVLYTVTMITMLSGVELPFPQGDKKLLCTYHTLRLMCISPDMHIYCIPHCHGNGLVINGVYLQYMCDYLTSSLVQFSDEFIDIRMHERLIAPPS